VFFLKEAVLGSDLSLIKLSERILTLRNGKAILIPLLTILASGCASLSTYQTAKTLEPGKKTIGFALSLSAINVDLGEEAAGFDETITYPVPEIFFRVGIKENLDVGVKFYPFAGLVDIKYQFINQPTFDLAFDLGVSYTKLSGIDSEIKLIDFYPTALLTYNVTPSGNATLAPKIIIRRVSGGNEAPEIFTMPGGTLALQKVSV